MATKSSSAAVKAARARSWAKGQAAKAERIADQEAKTKANEAYRKRGEPTPYQQRKREKNLARLAEKYGQQDSTMLQ